MEIQFSFDRPASGSRILGRTQEIDSIAESILVHHRGVSIIGAPKTGKETVVRAALAKLRSFSLKFTVCEMDFFNVSTYKEFIDLFRMKMSECFDSVNSSAILPFSVDVESLSPEKILALPQTVASESGIPLILYMKEFQNVIRISESGFSMASLEKAWLRQHNVFFIITGSGVNAMKSVFEERKVFYYLTEPITLKPFTRKELVSFITREFLEVGREIQREQAEEIIDITGGNIWYIKQFCAICHCIPAGYINKSIVRQGRLALMELNAPRFRQIMSDLTHNQINFLRAISDGCRKLSGSECLEKYNLNSSANVFRLKDAFKKKELVTFDRNDEPVILDSLFAVWLRDFYFSRQIRH